MLPSRRRLFQQDNAKPHTAAIITAWLRSRRVRVLNWPACSPDLSPIENIWCIIKRKIHQRRPRTLQQLETYIRQEWDQIPTPKLQKLLTSMPRCFKLFWKEEEMLHHGKHAPVPTILRPVAASNLKWAHFVHKIVKFLSLNICYVIYVLLWIKYWLMWFEILLVFILFKLKKMSQHFRNSGCIRIYIYTTGPLNAWIWLADERSKVCNYFQGNARRM